MKMKKLLSFLLAALMSVMLLPVTTFAGADNGKVLPYSFDFETDITEEGWTNIDFDGDDQDWITGTNNYGDEKWGVDESKCAISQSYDNYQGAFDADNWLFSPALKIPAGGAKISWYEKSQDADYPDSYMVYVGERIEATVYDEASNPTGTMKQIYAGEAANPWMQRTVELSAEEYGGKTVYIAFRHVSYDCYMLEIDDFAAVPLYTIIKGADQTVDENAESAVFSSDAEFSKFVRVEVDEEIVDPSNYEVKSGSTVVTLKKAYISTLTAGEHTLTIVSSDGSAKTKFTIVETPPETGDQNAFVLWCVLLLAAGGALAGMMVYKRRVEE